MIKKTFALTKRNLEQINKIKQSCGFSSAAEVIRNCIAFYHDKKIK